MSELLDMFNSIDEASEVFRVTMYDDDGDVVIGDDYNYDRHVEHLYQADKTYGDEGTHLVIDSSYFFLKLKERPTLRKALIQLLEESDTLEQ